MNPALFHERADDVLTELLEAIEAADKDGVIEADYLDGILTIELVDEGTEYIINKHSPTAQIWVSSPRSGASYYNYNEKQDKWLSNSDAEIFDVIMGELFG